MAFQHSVPLPGGWTHHVKSGLVHAISLDGIISASKKTAEFGGPIQRVAEIVPSIGRACAGPDVPNTAGA
jgi:hypothetical protein